MNQFYAFVQIIFIVAAIGVFVQFYRLSTMLVDTMGRYDFIEERIAHEFDLRELEKSKKVQEMINKLKDD